MMTLDENGQSQLYINELWFHYLLPENLRHDVCFSQYPIICSAKAEALHNYDSIADNFNHLFLTLIPTLVCIIRSQVLTNKNRKKHTIY